MDEAVLLFRRAVELGLDMPHFWISAPEARIAYNGVGPEWFSKEVRDLLGEIDEPLKPAIFVHDVDFSMGDGSCGDFCRANARLRRNGRICADAAYGWWRPARYRLRRRVALYASLSQLFGWSAYCAAIEQMKEARENMQKEEEKGDE